MGKCNEENYRVLFENIPNKIKQKQNLEKKKSKNNFSDQQFTI